MGSRLAITPPDDYLLARDACSYGYFLLEPNHWDPVRRTLSRVLDLAEGPALVTIAQDDDAPRAGRVSRRSARPSDEAEERRGPGLRPGAPLRLRFDRALTRAEQGEARRQIARMLRLDESAGSLAEFHRLDPRFAASGRGRLFRSPTFFEDLVKTVTSCNVTWPGTIRMNERLCAVVGRGGAFPRATQLARRRPESLRARCGVGYRDRRLVELASLASSGKLEAEWFEDPGVPDDEVRRALLALPGIGPYAAANVMQLLGRYAHLPLDTESVRHGRTVLGMEGTDAQIMKRVAAHFEPFGAQRFRSYWFELWEFYESRRGPSWTWEKRTTGATFTASKLAQDAQDAGP